jgi:glycosyl transferase family 25
MSVLSAPKTAPCPVYVISLPGTDARQASIKAQLDELGLPFEFVDAMRGSSLSAEERAQKVGPSTEMMKHICRTMSDGEIGCALSHQKVYDKVISEGHAYAFVLEDDALLLPGLIEVLNAAVKEPELDLLIFGYPKLAKEDIDNVMLYDPVMTLGKLGQSHSYGIRPYESHLGMVGYLVSQRGCQKLKMNDPLVTVADDHRFFANVANVWHLRPFGVAEDAVHVSTIRGDFRRNRFGLSLRQKSSRIVRGLWRHLIVLCMQLGIKSVNKPVKKEA